MDPIRKQCACGRAWSWLSWSALPMVGTMDVELGLLELRNCTCGSTLAVERRPSDFTRHQAALARARAAALVARATTLVATARERIRSTG